MDLESKLDMINPTNGFWKKQQVWYTARTHAQIAQTMSEVRRCDIEGLSVAVLGARDQLCVNPEVMQEKEFYMKVFIIL